MTLRLRKMRPYHPRRRGKRTDLDKQALYDSKHKMSSVVSTLIVFIEQGNASQIPAAQQKAKSDFLKYAVEMKKIAEKMGDRYIRIVDDYLDSIDVILHSNATWDIDDAKIQHCYKMSEKLEREISAA
jgi:hypothetical protein